MIALSVVLRIARTLDGAEIDSIISDVEARKAVAVEHRRRADWRKRESVGGSQLSRGMSSPECRSDVTFCTRSARVNSDS
jgi:hypothetical protein